MSHPSEQQHTPKKPQEQKREARPSEPHPSPSKTKKSTDRTGNAQLNDQPGSAPESGDKLP